MGIRGVCLFHIYRKSVCARIRLENLGTSSLLLPPVLEERRKLNAPVKSIDIKQCHVSEEWVDELRGNVPTVTWDGKTTPDGYDDDENFDRDTDDDDDDDDW